MDPSLDAKEVKSFVPPLLDDASYVDAGGYFGAYLDLDGSLKTEQEFIAKYREMSLHPEVESAIEDVCNEAIVFDEERKSVELVLDQVDISDQMKGKIQEEYAQILRLLDFGKEL